MSIFRKIRILRWSFRKLNKPVYGKGLVIDIGGGANPHPFADVFVEKYVDSRNRLKPLKKDTRLILADAEKLPFKDKSFDYSFSFHVLEHTKNPDAFLDETQRISKSGYIETPNLVYETFHPYDVHILKVWEDKGVLNIIKKTSAIEDSEIAGLEIFRKNKSWKKLFTTRPELFHVCYNWKDKIYYKVLNNNVNLDWFEDSIHHESNEEASLGALKGEFNSRGKIRLFTIELLSLLKPKKKLDLDSLLCCPECRKDLIRKEDHYFCSNNSCRMTYNAKPYPDFREGKTS